MEDDLAKCCHTLDTGTNVMLLINYASTKTKSNPLNQRVKSVLLFIAQQHSMEQMGQYFGQIHVLKGTFSFFQFPVISKGAAVKIYAQVSVANKCFSFLWLLSSGRWWWVVACKVYVQFGEKSPQLFSRVVESVRKGVVQNMLSPLWFII